jgi:hypothetical protein
MATERKNNNNNNVNFLLSSNEKPNPISKRLNFNDAAAQKKSKAKLCSELMASFDAAPN